MCRKIQAADAENAIGYYQKGNEPEPIKMAVIVAPCVCGDGFFARWPTGLAWVSAVPYAERDVADAEMQWLTEAAEKFPVSGEGS